MDGARVRLLLRVKLRRSQYEHMFSALPPNSDIARCSWHFAFVPGADQALSQLLQLPRDKCAARMSAAKSSSGAVKSVPAVATLILATLTGAVGCRRIHRS